MARVRVFACAGLLGVIGGGALLLSLLAGEAGMRRFFPAAMAGLVAEEPAPAAERRATAEEALAEATPRRALLFQRFTTEGNRAKEGVLEAAFFEDGQVQLRELHTFAEAESLLRPFGRGPGPGVRSASG
jgi:hypothetical protein